ncbi:YcdB/YcdC domain-containing protein [Edaphobacillus lindanitolerans]|nr:YcdB/YcdC domain-containing protein [Edaphobacillus lindanitolerans]
MEMETLNHWVKKLLPYMEGVRIDDIELETLEDDPGSCMLVRRSSGETIAEMVLDGDGELRFFSCFRATEFAPVVTLAPHMIRKISEQFIRAVFSDDANTLAFSSVVDLDSIYSVDFVRKDMDGIELPNSGVSFSFWKDGRLLDMTNHLGPLILVNEEEAISPEAALDLFMANLNGDLKISRYDSEIYVDGDDDFHLIYDFLTGTPDEVKMDGTVFSLAEEMGYFLPEFEKLDHSHVNPVRVEEAMGIGGMKRIHEEMLDDMSFEIYSGSAEPLKETMRLYDPEEPVEHAVKLISDPRTNRIRSAVGFPVPGKDSGPAGRKEAYETALAILFGEFPDARSLFQLRKEEPELYGETDGEIKVEGYQFIFDRFHGELQIEDECVEIDIDAQTGRVVRYQASGSIDFDGEALTSEPPIDMSAAKALYMSNIRMRPVRARNENDGGAPVYELVYVPEFPPPGGHIHAIDAHSLEKWTVDTGALLEE